MSPCQESLKLFHASLYMHYPVNSGCPSHFNHAPFGFYKPLANRIAEIVYDTVPAKIDVSSVARIYARYYIEFTDILNAVQLAPGTYRVPDVSAGLRIVNEMLQEGEDEDVISRTAISMIESCFKDFMTDVTVTETTLAMARASTWQIEQGLDCEATDGGEAEEYLLRIFPAFEKITEHAQNEGLPLDYPVITGDGKRPYGDMTYYYYDLESRGIPGIKGDIPTEGRSQFSSEEQSRIDAIQAKLYLTLQAMACYGRP